MCLLNMLTKQQILRRQMFFFMAVSPRITGKRSYTSWKSVLLTAYWPVARLKSSGVLMHRCTFNEVTVAEKQGHGVKLNAHIRGDAAVSQNMYNHIPVTRERHPLCQPPLRRLMALFETFKHIYDLGVFTHASSSDSALSAHFPLSPNKCIHLQQQVIFSLKY